MKTTLTILLSVFIAAITFGQITTQSVAEKRVNKTTPYDSTENFLKGEVYKYIGQELYVKPLSESLRQYGYGGFFLSHVASEFDRQNVYKWGTSYNSSYNELVGKYFKVLDVVTKEGSTIPFIEYGKDSSKDYFLKLLRKDVADTVYFHYNGYEFDFPFMVVGYFEKQKKIIVGKEFVLMGKNSFNLGKPTHDFISGNPVDITTGVYWKAKDVTIEEKYYMISLILENNNGENVLFNMEDINDPAFILKKAVADNYKKSFGNEFWNSILKGKVKIGMTKKMCKLSWGEPKSINQTITSGKKSEQWVYSANYLYFDNGILTAIQ